MDAEGGAGGGGPEASASPSILVVDDEEYIRDILRRRLEREGYRVTLAADGLQALGLLREQPVDLVVLDVMMPGMSGLELLEAMRRTPAFADLPVVMASALGESADVVKALEKGANDYVTKPIDFPVALARVRRQLELRLKQRALPSVAVPAGGGGARSPAPASLESFLPTLSLPPSGPSGSFGAAPGSASFELGPFAPSDAFLGAVLGDRYRIEATIGTGAFGAVYRATHIGLEKQVAVKVLLVNLKTTGQDFARFRREAVTACRLRHPNAVAVLDIGMTPGGLPYLVMELLEGHTLAEEMQRRGPLPPARCAEVLLPVADLLVEAHAQGLIHRDLKPANIFLHRDRDAEVVKVVDFGLAKVMGDSTALGGSDVTVSGHVLGTPAYMAPERLRDEAYDGRADVYSLGVVLYEMLAGRPPFRAVDRNVFAVAMMHLREEVPPLGDRGIPAAVEEAVVAALAKDPAQRPGARGLALTFAAAAGIAVRSGVYRNLGA